MENDDGTDFEALVRLIARAESGARFEHALARGERAPGAHVYPEEGRAEPGREVRARVRLAEPALHPRSLWEGQTIELFADGQAAGSARVREVTRAILDRDSRVAIPEQDAAAVVCARVHALRSQGGTLRARVRECALGDALERISVSALAAPLSEHPEWVSAWYEWAEAHRLRAGPFLFRYGTGGWTGVYEPSGIAMQSMRFEDPVRACAEFIALELEEGFTRDEPAPGTPAQPAESK